MTRGQTLNHFLYFNSEMICPKSLDFFPSEYFDDFSAESTDAENSPENSYKNLKEINVKSPEEGVETLIE